MTIKEALTAAILAEEIIWKNPRSRASGPKPPFLVRQWRYGDYPGGKVPHGTPGFTLMKQAGSRKVKTHADSPAMMVPTIRGGDVRDPAKVDLVRTADGQAELRKTGSPQEKTAKAIQQARKDLKIKSDSIHDLNISQGHPDGHIRLTTRNQN